VFDIDVNNDVFLVDQTDTRVNDLSEVFCSQSGKYFIAPDAARAIGAMSTAGIDINNLISQRAE